MTTSGIFVKSHISSPTHHAHIQTP